MKARRDSVLVLLEEEAAARVRAQNKELSESVKDSTAQSSDHEFEQPNRVLEMELQVGIIKREREISDMRAAKIGALRAKYGNNQ